MSRFPLFFVFLLDFPVPSGIFCTALILEVKVNLPAGANLPAVKIYF